MNKEKRIEMIKNSRFLNSLVKFMAKYNNKFNNKYNNKFKSEEDKIIEIYNVIGLSRTKARITPVIKMKLESSRKFLLEENGSPELINIIEDELKKAVTIYSHKVTSMIGTDFIYQIR